jgi:hypothetical protein
MNTNKLNPRFHQLTSDERNLIAPALINLLKAQKKPLPTYSILEKLEEVRKACPMRINGKKVPFWDSKVNPVRLRKLINWIRGNQMLGIIGNDEGYFATDNFELLELQIQRMESRISSQMFQLEGTREYLKNLKAEADAAADIWGGKKL